MTMGQPLLKILHIEDDPDYQKILRVYLKNIADLSQVITGEEGLKIYNQSFDLIICDGNLPLMNGVEVVKSILKNYPEARIIANSNDSKINSLMKDSGAYLKTPKSTTQKEWINLLNKIKVR